MDHRVLIQRRCLISLIVGVSLPLILACTSRDGTGEGQPSQSPPSPAESVRKTSDPVEVRSTSGRSVAHLGQGTITVFGIALPSGMRPAAAPQGIYRFEGLYPASQVERQIADQINYKRESRDTSGVLFRNSRPKKATSHLDQRTTLAIRVGDKKGGGCRLDVWLDRTVVSAKEKPGVRPRASRTATGPSARAAPSTKRRRSSMSQRQQQKMVESLRVLDKLADRKKLDDEDKKSSFFH